MRTDPETVTVSSGSVWEANDQADRTDPATDAGPWVPADTRRTIMAEASHITRSTTELHARTPDAFNRRDWDALLAIIADDATYIDHAQGVTVHGPEGTVGLLRAWTAAFSDAHLKDNTYYQDGDVSVTTFVGCGTQDGPLGPFPPSNQYTETAFCEVVRFDSAGKVASGEVFYDQLGMLTRLGHIPADG